MGDKLLMIRVQLVDISANVLAADLVPAVRLALGLIMITEILGESS